MNWSSTLPLLIGIQLTPPQYPYINSAQMFQNCAAMNIQKWLNHKITHSKKVSKPDRLSSLPDHLLIEILSLLPITTVVSTSVLSRRWQHLWTHVTHFHFTSSHLANRVALRAFFTNINTILTRFDKEKFCTFSLKFSLPNSDLGPPFEDCQPYDELCYDYLSPLLHSLCNSRTECLILRDTETDIYVLIQNNNDLNAIEKDSGNARRLKPPLYVMLLLECLFSSETLVELELSNAFFYKLPDIANLPNLKKLSIRVFDDYRELMQMIFKSSPLLEHLCLDFALSVDGHVIDVSAPNLKIIEVSFLMGTDKVTISIDAPKLEHIAIKSSSSVLIQFVKIPIGLMKANIMLIPDIFLGVDNVTQILALLKGVSRARSLVVHIHTLNMLNSADIDEGPTFDNLSHLRLMLSGTKYTNSGIPGFIFRTIKTIEVTNLLGNDEEMRLLENILNNAYDLERLCVFVSDSDDELKFDSLQKESDFVVGLFMLPSVSSCCEIEFIGRFVRASTNGLETGSLIYQVSASSSKLTKLLQVLMP